MRVVGAWICAIAVIAGGCALWFLGAGAASGRLHSLVMVCCTGAIIGVMVMLFGEKAAAPEPPARIPQPALDPEPDPAPASASASASVPTPVPVPVPVAGLVVDLVPASARAPAAAPATAVAASNDDEAVENFQYAINRDDVVTVQRMLASGEIRAGGATTKGRGFLQFAVVRDAEQATAALLAAGASPSARDALGKSAIDLALQYEQEDMLAVLQQYLAAEREPGAEPSAPEAGPAHDPLRQSQLAQLAQLRSAGVLTEAEFLAARARLLAAP